jgi:hypothetical protein
MTTARSKQRRRTPLGARFPKLALGDDFRFQPKAVLREYADWYVANESRCIRRLEDEVRASSRDLAAWRADLSPRSFVELEPWLVRTCWIRMSKAEILPVRKGKHVLHIEIDPYETLQARSVVPVFCLGVYFGAVLMKRHPHLGYRHYFKTSFNFHHGHMALEPVSGGAFDYLIPVWTVRLSALSIRDTDRVKRGWTLGALLKSCEEDERKGGAHDRTA